MRSARGDVESWEVGIIAGHWDRPALGVDCLGGITSPAVQDDVVDPLVDRGEGDVMVQELAKLHQHESVA